MKNQSKPRDLFVTDISFDATEEDLEKLFAVCGTVKHIRLLTDPRSGQFTGRAFVSMANADQARDAVNMLDEARLINRCIKVKSARDKPPGTVQQKQKPTQKPKRLHQRPKRTRR